MMSNRGRSRYTTIIRFVTESGIETRNYVKDLKGLGPGLRPWLADSGP